MSAGQYHYKVEPTQEDVDRLRAEVVKAREQVRTNEETIRSLSALVSSSTQQNFSSPPPPATHVPPPSFSAPPPSVTVAPAIIPPAPAPNATFSSYKPPTKAPPASTSIFDNLGLPVIPPLDSEAPGIVQRPKIPPKPVHLLNSAPSAVNLQDSSPISVELHTPRFFGDFSCRDGELLNTQAKRLLKKSRPILPVDLNHGIDEFFFVEGKNEIFELLQTWISTNADSEESLYETVDQSDFVCLRGTLIRFAETNLERRNFRKIQIAATKVNGVIFLCEHTWYHTESKKAAVYQQLKCIEAVSEYEEGDDHELAEEYYAVLTADFVPVEQISDAKTIRVLYSAKVDLIDSQTGERCQVQTYIAKSNQTAQLRGALMAPAAVVQCQVTSGHLVNYNKVPLPTTTPTVQNSATTIYQILHGIKEYMDREPEGTLVMIERKENSSEFTICSSNDQSRRFMNKAFLRHFRQT